MKCVCACAWIGRWAMGLGIFERAGRFFFVFVFVFPSYWVLVGFLLSSFFVFLHGLYSVIGDVCFLSSLFVDLVGLWGFTLLRVCFFKRKIVSPPPMDGRSWPFLVSPSRLSYSLSLSPFIYLSFYISVYPPPLFFLFSVLCLFIIHQLLFSSFLSRSLVAGSLARSFGHSSIIRSTLHD